MGIVNFLKRLWAAAKRLFDGLPNELQDAVHIGVVVVENLKNFVESPGADILTAIIPGDLDDKVKQVLRAVLPDLLIKLKLADVPRTYQPTADQILKLAINTLQEMDKDIKGGFLHNLSIIVAQVVADGKLSWEDGVYILQWYYDNRFKKDN